MSFRTEVTKSDLIGIGVDITEVCNRKCITCYANLKPQHMALNLFKKIVDEGVACGFRELYILGGEPTCHPEIMSFLDYAKGKFELVILVSNVDRFASLDFCKEIESKGVTIAGQRHTVRDDDSSKRMENFLTGIDSYSSMSKAWANISKIFPANRVCVQCCITRPVVEQGDIFDLFRWIRKNRFDPVMEFTKEGGSFKRGCEWDIDPEEMMDILQKFQKIDQEEFGIITHQLTPQAYDKTCHLLENSIHFLVDGTAIPCVGYRNLIYGNIDNHSLHDIVNNPLRQVLINPKKWIYGYCSEECEYFEECTGGCRGSAFDTSGCPRASFYYCPHIPRDRVSFRDTIPPSCEGCYLESSLACNPKR